MSENYHLAKQTDKNNATAIFLGRIKNASSLISLRRSVLAVMALLVLIFVPSILIADELTIHDGTTTNGYVPVYGFYADAYLKSEFVVPASELAVMTGASITGMTFYASQTSVSWGSANFQVFLTEIASTTISAFNGPGTVVYTGALNITGGTMTVNFTTSYTYNGGNLLVGIYNTVTGSYVTSSWYGETVSGASVQGYSYSSLTDVTATQRNFIPKTTFTYSGGCTQRSGTFEFVNSLHSIVAGQSYTNTLNNTTGVTTGISYSISPNNVSGVTFNPSTGAVTTSAGIEQDFTITATLDGNSTYCDKSTSYTLSVGDGCLRINDGTSTTSYAPFYGFYNHSWCQMLYTAEELGNQCCNITKIAFNVATVQSRTWATKIYMKLVHKTTFTSTTDFVSMSESDLVWSGDWNTGTAGWNEFVLNRSFAYDCNYELLIGVKWDGDYSSSVGFYYTGTTNYTTIYEYEDGSPADITAGSFLSNKGRLQGHPNLKVCMECIDCTDREGTASISGCSATTLTIGHTRQLTGSVSVGAGDASWSSSDPAVATVSSSGLVTAVGPGTAIITYKRDYDGTYCEVMATCSVTTACGESWNIDEIAGQTKDIECGTSYCFYDSGGPDGGYANNENYTVTFTSTGTIHMRLLELQTESVSYDYITITGTDNDGTFGTNGGVIPSVFTSTGGDVSVTWVSDVSTTAAGFRAIITAEDCQTCDGTIVLNRNLEQELDCNATYCFYDSGGKSGSYSNGEDYTAIFTSSGEITLSLSIYSTESYWDYLTIYDGGVGGLLLFDGYGVSTVPSPMTASSGMMTVLWHSDASNVYGGWKATITSTGCCPRPADVTVADITDTSAQVSWTGDAAAGSYNVRYREVGSNFSEGFESGIPATWTTIDADGDGNNWLAVNDIHTTYTYYDAIDLGGWVHSGTDAASSPSSYNNPGSGYTSLNTDHWLITPQIDLGGAAKFYVSSADGIYPDDYEVLLSTTGRSTTDFTTTLKPMSTAPDHTISWEEVNIDLSAYNGQQGYIAIHHVSNDMYFLLVDDFEVSGPWTYITTTETSANLTNLETLTTYEVQVQSDCGGGSESTWSPVEIFVTPPPAPTVTQTDAQLPECDNGNATLVASASIIPDGYSFHWYSNSTCTTEITTGLSGTNNNTLSYPASSSAQVWCRLEKRFTMLTYNYTGGVQSYAIPEGSSSITMEVWGAQGGYRSNAAYGGKGGYSIGTLTSPTAGNVLYVVVGGSGNTGGTSGGYNGGGSRNTYNGGGGATHIATASGVLSSLSANQASVLIVAGGGGSDGGSDYAGGAGGGLNGVSSTNGWGTGGVGGTQSAGGENDGAFGQGGSGVYQSSGYGGAGGGGWYGGGGTTPDSSGDDDKGGGGGSGYLKSTLTNASTTAGQREGDGLAKITVVHPSGTDTESASVAYAVTIQCCALDADIEFPEP